ncbi:LD-carboxypeptidase [Lacibacter sp.]|uniref:S66 peptidase family protein n=1 Tax=Lacibacter sp. TaxID=1915409 RepID=UPI002B4AFB88|nr:LD-carboxypeptidase [Lacibacter sp.]HLP38300.1 LD-carboxypeptidase [Lacibacter sp.]
MKRKHFLQSVLPAGLLFTDGLHASNAEQLADEPYHPPYLKDGDTIGITSPAGYITEKEIQPAIQQIESWGFKVKIGNSIGKRDFTFGGTDEERRADFQQLIDDPKVKAILCARGGYGFVRIVDQLDFSKMKTHPKWMIGFSDITVLHAHLNRNFGIASIHSKMCNSFPDDWSKAEPIQIETILSIRDALKGVDMKYTAPANEKNRLGVATGTLVGGNLKTLESLAGSKSDLRTTNKILFVEDTGEYLYSIDRMFWNLKRSDKLDHLAGLIIGGFKIKASEDAAEEFGKNLYDIVMEKIPDCTYPVCFDFPVGHQKNNYALKCGVKHKLQVTTNGSILTDIQ